MPLEHVTTQVWRTSNGEVFLDKSEAVDVELGLIEEDFAKAIQNAGCDAGLGHINKVVSTLAENPKVLRSFLDRLDEMNAAKAKA